MVPYTWLEHLLCTTNPARHPPTHVVFFPPHAVHLQPQPIPLQMVTLIREPENPYDHWAVRVDNVRGEKVGHLPRVLVCHVSA